MIAQEIKVGRYYTDSVLGLVKILDIDEPKDSLRLGLLEGNTDRYIGNNEDGYLFGLTEVIKDISETGSMKERLANGLSDALVSRGRAKGMLKKKSPPVNTVGAAVWQALQSCSNPYKVGFCHLMFMDASNREVYDYVVQLGKTIDLSRLDRDSNLLKDLGVW